MRAQTSVTLISLLLGSVAVGLHQVEFLPGLKQISLTALLTHSEPQSYYLAHRGSGRIESRFHSPFNTQNFA